MSKLKYDKSYDKLLVDHLSQGLSFSSFAAVVKVNANTLFEWAEKYPSFKQAKVDGTAQSLLFWEKIGIAGTVGKIKNFNTATWIFNMKNRFHWSNREETRNLNESSDYVTHDKIMKYLEEEDENNS